MGNYFYSFIYIAVIEPNSRIGLFISSLVGFIFGFAMNKARVMDPSVIQDQMVMSRFVMLKLFLTASGTSIMLATIFTL